MIFSITTLDTLKVLTINQPESFSQYIQNPNTMIAITAVIVSIVGLALSIFFYNKTLKVTITHNEKSLEPILTHLYTMFEEDFSEKFLITNSGLGPAIVKSIKFSYQGIEYNSFTDLYAKFNSIRLTYLLKKKSKVYFIGDEDVWSVNQNVILHELYFSQADENDDWHNILKEVKVLINYTTIYDINKVYEQVLMCK